LIVNPNNPNAASDIRDAKMAAQTLGQQIIVLNASTARDIDTAFASLVHARAGALVVGAGAFLLSRRNQIIALAARNAIPTIYGFREYLDDGGLISYGNNIRMRFIERASTLAGFSRVTSRPICQSSARPNSSW